jgi:hypothetical protein
MEKNLSHYLLVPVSLALALALLMFCRIPQAWSSETKQYSSEQESQSSQTSYASSASRLRPSYSEENSCNHQAFQGEFNIDKLAAAVAQHETCGCTCGTAVVEEGEDGYVKNNCFGMHNPGGKEINGHVAKTYATKEESYADFKTQWSNGYGGFPTLAKAAKYSGHEDGCPWLTDVAKNYNNQ